MYVHALILGLAFDYKQYLCMLTIMFIHVHTYMYVLVMIHAYGLYDNIDYYMYVVACVLTYIIRTGVCTNRRKKCVRFCKVRTYM